MTFPQLVFWSPVWMMLCDHTSDVAHITKGKNSPSHHHSRQGRDSLLWSLTQPFLTHNFGSPADNLNAFQHFLNRNHLRFTGWPGGLIFISQRRNPEEKPRGGGGGALVHNRSCAHWLNMNDGDKTRRRSESFNEGQPTRSTTVAALVSLLRGFAERRPRVPDLSTDSPLSSHKLGTYGFCRGAAHSALILTVITCRPGVFLEAQRENTAKQENTLWPVHF